MHFRYMRELAIERRDNCVMFSVDDKHKIKTGEPGYPVAAIDRGKSVLVGNGKVFEVADHDFTKSTLTPSVIFVPDIPENITGK